MFGGDGPATSNRPPLLFLLRVWLGIGGQSFGGGGATQFLIYRAVVEKHRWMAAAEFTHAFALCQLAPGINLLALTVLIGWRLRGAPGVAVSLFGLLLPSVSITVLLTALYAGVRDSALVRAALRGVVPATVGLGLLVAWQVSRPLLAAARREGRGSLLFTLALIGGSGAVVALSALPVFLVLVGAALISAMHAWGMATRSGRAGG